MDTNLIDSLLYKKHIELSTYFNSFPFNAIYISNDNKSKLLDYGYIRNLTIRFWRLLQIEKLLDNKKADSDYCDFLLENFLNQALSCTDALANCLNHFLNIGLKGKHLAVQGYKFHDELKRKLSTFSKLPKIEAFHDWTKNKLYPYRNIVHHRGDSSGGVEMGDNFSAECCLTLEENEWDFITIEKDLRDYPTHMTYLIITDSLNLPTLSDWGDAHKYIRIDNFFRNWIAKIYDLIKVHVEGIVWYQTLLIRNDI